MMETQALDFPKIDAILRSNGTGEVTINGTSHPIEADNEATVLKEALALITETAAQLGRPVKVSTTDPDGQGTIIVSPEGDVSEAASTKTAKTSPRRHKTPEPTAQPVRTAPADVEAPATPAAAPAETARFAAAATPTKQPAPSTEAASAEPSTRRSLKDTSFLVSAPILEPATRGWRRVLTRLGFRMDPSAEELAEREDIRTVSQHWPGPRTVAVVNRKGGANKTPTVVMLSAILARYSGAATVAWDNNESQGTLGWRTEKGSHDRSVLDLIDSSQTLLSPSAQAAEIARFVHHQTSDKFDVLRSDENDEGDHEVTAEEVDIAHQVLTRYYRLIVMDSGNTSRAANWRRMIHHTNQLVVPVTAIEDRAEAARLTLQTLESRGGHDAELARNAVVIVSESTDAKRSMNGDALKRAKDEARRIAEGFAPHVRAVVRIPYDPALVNGPIRYDALQPATQRAWLAAAAAVAKGF
ncbi:MULTISPECIES: chromosome partitioning protein ParA [Paenarthrobacter]|uniref:Chromosome partitioning protein ParA n=1 Tax=Paenarthrobacter ureafaciens TaxID=37931 RepID=A0AAX3EPS8_PAEUR|nr:MULTISPECIES: chromosome partitioning protein ParA [Paenarthrobacter]NKR13746.1 chromosome partitioning protein ParA [Arthrobacter sp. M5]NKR18259.1 chromosome partitioning protein ParA [Arthrobacter sp. M6]MDO5866953.1 chromosome partitioning protein ParA [Paenarthrobacter sp. SD-2]MDO5878002.1 chromosome partitioning protein ParA [Paenarthrobacter sp. SD-1]UYV95361.1 chromosome partitioning protein ParA [Paenarthrobacter ureafaciens]